MLTSLAMLLNAEQIRRLREYSPRIGGGESAIVDALDTFAAGVIANSEERNARLAATTTGDGGSLIGVEDAGGFYAGDNVEAVLQEIGNDLPLSFDNGVKATIAVADAGGGGTTALLTVDLFRADGTTVLGGARQALILTGAGQYTPRQALNTHATFGTATKGSVIAQAAGWCLFESDADGEFDCTVTNTSDEAVYFWVETAERVSDLTKACAVLGSNSDLATWSA